MRPILLSSVLPALVLSLCLSCGSTTSRLMPGYSGLTVKGKNVGIILMAKNLSISNPEELAMLGNNSAEVNFYEFLGNELPPLLHKYKKFQKVRFLWGADERMGRGAAMENSGGSVTMPPGRRFISDTIPYLLIIDFANVSHDRGGTAPIVNTEGSFAQGSFNFGIDYLLWSATYILWDNVTGSIAIYGTFNEKAGIGEKVEMSTWKELLKCIAEGIKSGVR